MRAALPSPEGTRLVRVGDVAAPSPRPGEVLVNVTAAGMNRADLLHARGTYAQRAFADSGRPDVCGMEMAGFVAEITDGVTDLAVGDRVMALCAGAYADQVAMDHRLLVPVPERLSLMEAAALPMALLTGHEALSRLAGVTPGETVLVIGATSAAGLAAVQLARLLGAEVVLATTRSPTSHALLQELGADHAGDDVDDLLDRSGARAIDVVIDHVGGALLVTALARLARGGRAVSVGRLGGRTAEIDLTALAGRRGRLIGTTWKTQTADDIAASVAAASPVLLDGITSGSLRPVLGRSWTLDEVPAAYDDLSAARAPGKPVVTIAAS